MDDAALADAVTQLAQLLIEEGRLLGWKFHNAQIIFVVPDDIPSPVVVKKSHRPGNEPPVQGPELPPVEVEFVAVVSARRQIRAASFTELGDQLVEQGYEMAKATDNGDGLVVPHPAKASAQILVEERS